MKPLALRWGRRFFSHLMMWFFILYTTPWDVYMGDFQKIEYSLLSTSFLWHKDTSQGSHKREPYTLIFVFYFTSDRGDLCGGWRYWVWRHLYTHALTYTYSAYPASAELTTLGSNVLECMKTVIVCLCEYVSYSFDPSSKPRLLW